MRQCQARELALVVERQSGWNNNQHLRTAGGQCRESAVDVLGATDLGGGQGGACACFSHDHIDLERNPFRRESREPIELPLGRSRFDQELRLSTLPRSRIPSSTEALKQTGVTVARLGLR